MDEVFGARNRIATISYVTTGGSSSATLSDVANYLLWYAKDRSSVKYRQLYESLGRAEVVKFFNWDAMVEWPDGTCRKPTSEERLDPIRFLPDGARLYKREQLLSPGVSTTGRSDPYMWKGSSYPCPENSHWRISMKGMDRLAELNRLDAASKNGRLSWKRYEDEVPGRRIHNVWPRQMSATGKRYVVQTAKQTVQRCILMTSDPGDLILDPTCGSGTTAFVAEQWGRRWITCDTSRGAIAIARQCLMTAVFDYYGLRRPTEGVGADIKCKSVRTCSARTRGYDEKPKEIQLFDQPEIDRSRIRVTGPFTVEAVPAPSVRPIGELLDSGDGLPADGSVARSGSTVRQGDWRQELLKAGIRGKGGERMRFVRLEPLPGTRSLHAVGEAAPEDRSGDGHCNDGSETYLKRAVVSFGPDHAPLEQRQVARAIEEAYAWVPKPTMVVFAAFQFDPEASKDIDETNWPGVTLLKAQMNADLLTDDLRKKRATNESFWLIGQPDVHLTRIEEGEDRGKYRVTVKGFDYYDVNSGNLEYGGANRIAMWMLDPNYDGRSLYARQVFFPMAGQKDGWGRSLAA